MWSVSVGSVAPSIMCTVYIRYIGSRAFGKEFSFGVVEEIENPKALMWLLAPPKPYPLSMPRLAWGEYCIPYAVLRVLPTLVGSSRLQLPLRNFYHHSGLFYHHSEGKKC